VNKVRTKKYVLGDLDPLDVFLRLRGIDDHCFILESVEAAQSNGEDTQLWTFIGWNPLLGLSLENGHYTETEVTSGTVLVDKEITDPSEVLSEVLNRYHIDRSMTESLPPFCGGLMGYFSFEYIKYWEPKLWTRFDEVENSERFNDFDLMLFDKVIAINKSLGELFIIVNEFNHDLSEMSASTGRERIGPEHGLWPSQDDGGSVFDKIYKLITTAPVVQRPALELSGSPQYLFNQDEFEQVIAKTKEHIVEGDVFQAVLSNRVSYEATGSLFDVYRNLRNANPSPYMFYLSSESLEIAGASPETLVSARYAHTSHVNAEEQPAGDTRLIARTFPLAGTRPRGASREEDEALEHDLLADQKELAEHNMLVDLGRNDLGKVCQFGSVEVEGYMDVLRFSHVMHIGSKVKGVLRDDVTAVDLIPAVLPAGTLSGAPKIKACEIISELEGDMRGVYGGCLGYLSLDGQMDTCITIRSAYMKGGKVYARSGAGIVLDSDPVSEFIETKNKIKAVCGAVEQSASAPRHPEAALATGSGPDDGGVSEACPRHPDTGVAWGQDLSGVHNPYRHPEAALATGSGSDDGGERSILLIDNYDSFVYNLYQMIGELNPNITVVRNDSLTVEQVREMNPTHIVLSPGPGYPKDAGICEDLIRQLHGEYPILGVCLGHQAICEVFGAEIVHAKTILHGKRSEISISPSSSLFEGVETGTVLTTGVARYHSLAASPESLANTDLTITATSEDGEVMAVQCDITFGVQFHPESILTDDGRQMLANFLQSS
jgi:anthranilate synthase component 1